MELQGQLIEIFSTQEVTSSFKKREFAIKTVGDYPQEIGLEVTQDKCDLLNYFNVGDNITASINIRGRKWYNESKGINQYFNTIQVWRVKKDDLSNQPQNNETQTESQDLPF